jgi:hypothetical protein
MRSSFFSLRSSRSLDCGDPTAYSAARPIIYQIMDIFYKPLPTIIISRLGNAVHERGLGQLAHTTLRA